MEQEAQTAEGGRWKRRIRNAFLTAAVLYVLGWAGANVVLNSSWAKARVGGRVAAIIGSPLEIGRVGVSPVGTLRLKDIRIHVHAPVSGDEETSETLAAEDATGAEEKTEPPSPSPPPPLFASKELRVKVSLLSLLTKSVRVKGILFEEPVFSLVRSEDGGFLLPERFSGLAGAGEAKPESAAGTKGPVVAAPQGGTPAPGGPVRPPVGPGGVAGALPPELAKEFDPSKIVLDEPEGTAAGAEGPMAPVEAGSVSTAQTAETGAASGEKTKPIVIRYGSRDFHFGEFKMQRGIVRVLSVNSGKELLRVEEMELRIAMGAERRDTGSFTAKKAVLVETIEAGPMRAEVEMEGLLLRFTDFEAELAEGKVEGSFKTSPFIPGFPFLAKLSVAGVSVPSLSEAVSTELGLDAGTLAGKVEAVGSLRSPETYRARGEFKVDGGHVTQIGLLAPLSGSIDFGGLEDIDLDEMLVQFSVLGGNVRLDDVRVSSPEIVMSGRGFVGFQGRISLAWRLYVSEDVFHAISMIEKRLPEGMDLGYRPFGNGDRHYRDYLIAGYVSNPVINFWKVDQGVRVEDLRAQIGQLLSKPVPQGNDPP